MSQHEKGPSNRRDSIGSSSGSPFRQRRSSLSIASPPNPSLPLAAAASINASMRGGSPGPETTAKDSVASRRSSVANELALADDSLPPPAEIAVGDRKAQFPDGQGASTGRIPSISTHGGSTGSLSVNPPGNHGSRTGSISSSPIDPFRTGALRDPFAGAPTTEGQPGSHRRTPSISQVHQEMEQEQEAQVNRLLVTIHQQQTLIEKLQRQLEGGGSHMDTSPSTTDPGSEHHGVMPERLPSGSSNLGTATPGLDYPPPPTPQRAHSSSSAGTTVASTMPAGRASPTFSSSASGRVSAMHMALSHQSQRAASSRGSSRAGSPAPRVTRRLGLGDDDPGKAASLDPGNAVRENELLKARIQELETQLRGLKAGGSALTSSQMDTSA